MVLKTIPGRLRTRNDLSIGKPMPLMIAQLYWEFNLVFSLVIKGLNIKFPCKYSFLMPEKSVALQPCEINPTNCLICSDSTGKIASSSLEKIEIEEYS